VRRMRKICEMTVFGRAAFLLLICCSVGCDAEEALVYRGASDASAAVAVSEDMFVVADDENNILRVYRTDEGGMPVETFDMTEFLGTEREHPEADIEGATKTGNRIYWITSHGRNKDGKMRPNRYRFFATEVDIKGGKVEIRPVGRPCRTLVQSMLRVKEIRDLGLDKATMLSKKEQKNLAPKEEGLNIEGLCASADGKTIYIGLRNPRPVDKSTGRSGAIVAPLKNAARVVEKGEEPIFGEPMLWDLAGLGIRSIEYSAFHKAYFIIAGEHDGGDRFALYKWSGGSGKPVLVGQLGGGDFGPEALIPFGNSARLLLLSDDGTLNVKVRGAWECEEDEYRDGTCPNKFLVNPNKKTFRAKWVVVRDP